MSAAIVQDIPAGLAQGLAAIDLAAWIRGAAWLFIGIPLTLAVSRWVRAWVSTNANPQQGLIVGKLIWYAGLFGILVTVLVDPPLLLNLQVFDFYIRQILLDVCLVHPVGVTAELGLLHGVRLGVMHP